MPKILYRYIIKIIYEKDMKKWKDPLMYESRISLCFDGQIISWLDFFASNLEISSEILQLIMKRAVT